MNESNSSTIFDKLRIKIKNSYLLELIVTILLLPFLYSVYFLSFLISRDKSTILFLSREGLQYFDNAWYLYEYLIFNKDKFKIRPILITKDQKLAKELKWFGYLAEYYLTPTSIFTHLRAKYYIVDTVVTTIGPLFGILSGNASVINLWHGIPIKRIGTETQRLGVRVFQKIRHWENKWKILVPSPRLVNRFHKIFSLSSYSQIIVAEYPRNIVLTTGINSQYTLHKFGDVLRFLDEVKIKNGRIFLYLPTFRDNETDIFENWNLDLKYLDGLLKKNNSYLLVKLHPVDALRLKTSGSWENNERIIILPPEIPVYYILTYADVLITDYSSIFYDYLILDRPIVFYPYDLYEYITNDRGLIWNSPQEYIKNVPGPVALFPQELYSLIRYYSTHTQDKYRIKRKKLLSLVSRYKGDIRGLTPLLKELSLKMA